MNTTPETKQEYTGTPEEVGAQLFVDALGPTIQATANSGATKEQMARLFAGMLAGLSGMLAENFGVDAAIEILRGTTNKLEIEALKLAAKDDWL